jgi:hypothetical protein
MNSYITNPSSHVAIEYIEHNLTALDRDPPAHDKRIGYERALRDMHAYLVGHTKIEHRTVAGNDAQSTNAKDIFSFYFPAAFPVTGAVANLSNSDFEEHLFATIDGLNEENADTDQKAGYLTALLDLAQDLCMTPVQVQHYRIMKEAEENLIFG